MSKNFIIVFCLWNFCYSYVDSLRKCKYACYFKPWNLNICSGKITKSCIQLLKSSCSYITITYEEVSMKFLPNKPEVFSHKTAVSTQKNEIKIYRSNTTSYVVSYTLKAMRDTVVLSKNKGKFYNSRNASFILCHNSYNKKWICMNGSTDISIYLHITCHLSKY